MKIQIDTDDKTIQLEDDILLKTLIIELKRLLPNNTWKSFTLCKQPIFNWINPIIVQPIDYISPTWISYPWISYDSGTTGGEIIDNTTINYNSGIYNIELK